MSLPAWADSMDKKALYGTAEALGASVTVLSDFDACSAFVKVKDKGKFDRNVLSCLLTVLFRIVLCVLMLIIVC